MSGIRKTKYNSHTFTPCSVYIFKGALLRLYNYMPYKLLQKVVCKLLKVKLSHILKFAFTWLP